MKITYYGHNTLLIQTEKHKILVDPFISGNPLNDGNVSPHDIAADFILVTHAHQDHTLDVEAIAHRTGALIISNYEIATHYQNLGLETHPMNHGGSYGFDFGTLKYVNAVHTSSFPDGSYGGQPGGFILMADGKEIYIAGDTALTMDMKLIAMTQKLDLAILPIGDNFTMGIDDAVIAADFVDCDKIMGVHYDTFGFIVIDHEYAVSAFAKANKTLHLLELTQSIEV